MTDRQLLDQYLEGKSQPAFAELVRRHIGWVRAAALRQVRGDAHLADDVAQAVFLALARQAHRLHAGAALSTWLFQVTRYAASAALRAESRRRRYERNAAMEASGRNHTSMTPQQWEQLSRMLDDLVARLRRDDRRAVLLRFYEQKSYPEMAAALGVSEEAARKRTDRAVEKLRQLAGRRDLALTAEALSAGLLVQAASPAPPAVTAAAIEMASGAAAAAGTPTAAIAEGAIRMMNLMKMRLPLAAGAAIVALLAISVTTWSDGAKTVAATQAATRPTAALVPATTPATTKPALVEDSPKAVVFAAFRAAAAGDADGLISRFDRVTPQQAETLRQTTEVMAASRRLGDAVKQQFGVDVEQTLGRSVGVGVAEFDVTSAGETIQGDSAIVEMKVGPGDIRLVRVGQTWKISGAVLQTMNAAGVRQLHANLPALEKLTADVGAGKYRTVEELSRAAGAIMQASRRRPTTSPRAQTRPVGQGR